MPLAFPVKSKVLQTEEKVSLLVHSYSNCLFIIVSELDSGSPGTLVQFQRELPTQAPELGCEESIYDISFLFGVEKPEILLAARVLGEKLHSSGSTDKPILFGIGLKRFDRPLLQAVGESLIQTVKGL